MKTHAGGTSLVSGRQIPRRSHEDTYPHHLGRRRWPRDRVSEIQSHFARERRPAEPPSTYCWQPPRLAAVCRSGAPHGGAKAQRVLDMPLRIRAWSVAGVLVREGLGTVGWGKLGEGNSLDHTCGPLERHCCWCCPMVCASTSRRLAHVSILYSDGPDDGEPMLVKACVSHEGIHAIAPA